MSDVSVISKLDNDLKSLDMTAILKYTRQLEEISGGLTSLSAPSYLRDFIIAFDVTNTMLSKAIYFHGQAEAALKTAQSIAFLDNAHEYLQERSIKDSAEARKQYIAVDPDVQKAEQVKARAEAMVSLLKNKLQAFRLAHDDIKKMAYTSDATNSGFEGM